MCENVYISVEVKLSKIREQMNAGNSITNITK